MEALTGAAEHAQRARTEKAASRLSREKSSDQALNFLTLFNVGQMYDAGVTAYLIEPIQES